MDFKKIIKKMDEMEILLLIIGFLLISYYICWSMRVNDGILFCLILVMCYIFGVDFGLRLAEVMK